MPLAYSVKNVSDDERGKIFEFLPALGTASIHINFMTIKAGKARGGHLHKYEEDFFVVSGQVRYLEYKEGQQELKSSRHGPGDTIKTTPGVAHMIMAVLDCVIVELRPADTSFKAQNDPQMRTVVELLASL